MRLWCIFVFIVMNEAADVYEVIDMLDDVYRNRRFAQEAFTFGLIRPKKPPINGDKADDKDNAVNFVMFNQGINYKQNKNSPTLKKHVEINAWCVLMLIQNNRCVGWDSDTGKPGSKNVFLQSQGPKVFPPGAIMPANIKDFPKKQTQGLESMKGTLNQQTRFQKLLARQKEIMEEAMRKRPTFGQNHINTRAHYRASNGLNYTSAQLEDARTNLLW